MGYLRLGQGVSTLSGGESQRLKIAAALGRAKRKTSAASTLYLFDEPTTGLHGVDVEALYRALRMLVERGDTVIAIEHHTDLIAASDYVVDLGPEGGADGGCVIACGTPAEIIANDASLTGRYLKPRKSSKRGVRKKNGRVKRETANGRANRNAIALHGVRENNLQNLSLDVPRDRLVVVTGVSGSGKSSLAFDVLFQEGQRRYLDTLSPYARQFIQQVRQPEVDRIDGLPAAIAIEQRTTRSGGNSTVATITEVWHGLRLMFTRIGEQHCTRCDKPVESIKPERIAALVIKRCAENKRSKVRLLAPVIRGRKGFHKDVLQGLSRAGFEQARIDREILKLKPLPKLDRYAEHDIDAIVFEASGNTRTNELETAVARALEVGDGSLSLLVGRDETHFSTHRFCRACGVGYPEPDPRRFSFNSRHGRCQACRGRGEKLCFTEDRVVMRPELSLAEGAIPALLVKPFSKRAAKAFAIQVRDALDIDVDRPWRKLGKRQRNAILEGTRDFEGLFARFEESLERKGGDALAELRVGLPCPACDGTRLNPISRAVTVKGASLGELGAMTVEEARTWLKKLSGKGARGLIIRELKRELLPRLGFLGDVGLDYLRLDRPGPSLSGGEAQRIRIAASLGSNLCGALYVLDEPTIGLHPSDHERLMSALLSLRDAGNTVVVVEHDEDTIQRADHVLELGPGAGKWGGRLVHQGTVKQLMRRKQSPTGRALAGVGREPDRTSANRNPTALGSA